MNKAFEKVDENGKKSFKSKNWYSIIKGLFAGLGKVVRPEASIEFIKEVIKRDGTIVKYTFRCKYR